MAIESTFLEQKHFHHRALTDSGYSSQQIGHVLKVGLTESKCHERADSEANKLLSCGKYLSYLKFDFNTVNTIP